MEKYIMWVTFTVFMLVVAFIAYRRMPFLHVHKLVKAISSVMTTDKSGGDLINVTTSGAEDISSMTGIVGNLGDGVESIETPGPVEL